MYGNHYGMSGWMWLWGAALIIGVLVLTGGLIWAIVASTGHRRTAATPPAGVAAYPAPARAILDQRYARGELGTDEYRERVHGLGG